MERLFAAGKIKLTKDPTKKESKASTSNRRPSEV
jgi:hypothetical protein